MVEFSHRSRGFSFSIICPPNSSVANTRSDIAWRHGCSQRKVYLGQPRRLLQEKACRPPARPASATLPGWAVLPVMGCFRPTPNCIARLSASSFPRWRRAGLPRRLKQEYLRRYRIPGRMFNSVRVSLEGKVSSVQGAMELRRDELQRRIARAQGQIAQAGDGVQGDWLHQKKRRLGNLKGKLERLDSDIAVWPDTAAALGPGGCGASSMPWKPTGIPIYGEWLRDWQLCPQRRVLRAGEPGRDGGLPVVRGHG